MASSSRAVKIAILDDYQDAALRMADWSVLPQGTEIKIFRDHLFEPSAVAERLQPYEIVCAMRERTPFPRALLERLPNLRLIATTGMWNAAIDIEAAKERGIIVCGTGAVAHSTAELTWALILGLVRNIPAEYNSVRNGGWQVSVGGDLNGRTLGLLGLGRLGLQVAGIGRAFGMKPIAWSQNLTSEKAEAGGVRLVSKEALFRESDVLSLHVVLSDRTRGLVGAPELKLMKPTAYLINSSRGPIVDEAALIETLKAGRIAGAALDVFEPEPLAPDHPFRTLPNVLATPHIGYVSEDTYRYFWGDTVENILAYLAGTPIRIIEDSWIRSPYVGR
jgi:phosphoglycerate dehydrogenase-like enzyme